MSNEVYVAMGANIFVKEIKKETKVGTLYIPDNLDVDFTFGEVVSCSEGYFDNGSFVPAFVEAGDKVAFAKISGVKVNFNGESLIRVFAKDIVAKAVAGKIITEESSE